MLGCGSRTRSGPPGYLRLPLLFAIDPRPRGRLLLHGAHRARRTAGPLTWAQVQSVPAGCFTARAEKMSEDIIWRALANDTSSERHGRVWGSLASVRTFGRSAPKESRADRVVGTPRTGSDVAAAG